MFWPVATSSWTQNNMVGLVEDAALRDVSVGCTWRKRDTRDAEHLATNLKRLMGPNLIGGVRGPHADDDEGACYRPISGHVS